MSVLSKQENVSSVYGPVQSWRVGMSLGIDLICETSVCSFNCIYCQLGAIQEIQNERRLFVSTERVLMDFTQSRWREADIITFTGSGEPALAVNLGEVSRGIAEISSVPQLVLTNGVLLGDPGTIEDLQSIDRVYVKLDAVTEKMFQRVNRPVSGITLSSIIENILLFKQVFSGFLGIQTMFLPGNESDLSQLAELLCRIDPDEVQLNTPTRPYPKYWHVSSRGGHSEELRKYKSVPLRTVSKERALEIEDHLRRETGLRIISVYRP